MLNISKEPLFNQVNISQFSSVKNLAKKSYSKQFNRISIIMLILIFIVMFLPWTQNVTGSGNVTTLKPDQRPQTIQSAIPGKIEEWMVNEGDFVIAGDTILRISEIKSEYFDEKLIERTGDQITSKSLSVDAYAQKISALQSQINALSSENRIKKNQASNKLIQSKLKLKSDSMDLQAAVTNEQIAQTQLDRVLLLQEKGLKATKDVEEKSLKLQEKQAKLIYQQNKLLQSQSEVSITQVELSRIDAAYGEKISKAQSDLHSTQSALYNSEVEVSKLENSYSNYEKRKALLHITAPQNGVINKAIKSGIGETFKAGEKLVNIMPTGYDLAVETYVRPIDLPLIHIGENVRVQFDGWPAIVFSGWESVSYGTYGAKVVAIENFISPNGKYRILLAPDEEDHEWPKGIRVGSGTKTIALLNDVPIWYELWRQINGFPPNFYAPEETDNSNYKAGNGSNSNGN